MRVGIRFKLIIFTSLLLAFVISLLSYLVLDGINTYQKQQQEKLLLTYKSNVEQYLSERLEIQQAQGSGTSIESIKDDIFSRPWLKRMPADLYTPDGSLITSYVNSESPIYVENEKEMLGLTMKNKICYEKIGNYINYFSPLKYKGETVALLRLDYSITEDNAFYKKIFDLFVLLGILALGAGISMEAVYFTRLTKVIYKLINNVERIRKGVYNSLGTFKRKDELGKLNEGIVFMGATIERNIEELTKEKNSLKLAVEKLKAMEKKQTEFLNNITHEFKTPITSIKAYADLVCMYEDDRVLSREAFESISIECERLRSMIDNILELSRTEKYDYEDNRKTVKVNDLLEQICTRMMGKIRKNNLTLETTLEDITIVADEENLRHIFINLMDNAIKYNLPYGRIKITLMKEGDKIGLKISDTGIGIPATDIDNIFEPFYRVDNHRSRERGGTGLGLSLVKKLVERINGSISVTSEENEGTTFIITLPAS